MAEESKPWPWQDENDMCSSDCDIKRDWDIKHDSGIQAWKITDDAIEEWKLAAEGKFFSDEVYIVLNCTYLKTSGTTNYDIHCWVGKQATFKSYKRGLYNTIALDDAMEGKALVHREVQDYESKRFTNYFDAFTVLKGKSDEMADVDLNTKYKDRVLRLSGITAGKNICVRETTYKRASLDSNDVCIVDKGTKICVWIGRLNKDEKKCERALEYAKQLQKERKNNGITVGIVEECERTKNHAIYSGFPNTAKKRKPSRQESIACTPGLTGEKTKMMYNMDGRDDQLKFTKVAEGADICSRIMDSKKVAIVDVRFGKMDGDDHLFIRIGDEWSGDTKSGLIYGHYYLKQCPDPHPTIAITVVKEGQLSTQLNAAINS